MPVGSGGRWAVVALLLAGVVYAWPTYIRYFGLHPGPMAAALLVAFAMYLPSLWVIRYLDRRGPKPPLLFWGSIVFVVLFAPITARAMHGIIDAGWLAYWVVVGPLEELTKLLLVIGSRLAPKPSMRDGIVVLVMATHGLNDLYGKIIGPLAIELLIGPAQRVGLDLATIAEGSPLIPLLLVCSAVASTLVMNLLLWAVLIWGLWYSGRADRGIRTADARTGSGG